MSARIRIPNFLKQLCHNTHVPPFSHLSVYAICPSSPPRLSVLSLAERDRRRSPAIASSLGQESNFTIMIIKCLPFAALHTRRWRRDALLLRYYSFEKKRVNCETLSNWRTRTIRLIFYIKLHLTIRWKKLRDSVSACLKNSHFHQLHFIRKSKN